ncbi:MAG: hypothetical protein K2L12_01045 [Clostridia bacterium]|nr:hypothetical protein [Clostridia bacterium]
MKKKTLAKIASVAMATTLAAGTVVGLAGCGNSKTKIGVLVADASGAEALGFQNYYTKYIEKNYDVDFIYSAELDTAEEEKAAIENFITTGCKAVISFASADRPAQIQQCQDAGIYYAVATGTLSETEYNGGEVAIDPTNPAAGTKKLPAAKDFKYYVGAIGPSLDVEYKAGYDMGKWAVEQFTASTSTAKHKFALHGAGVGYRLDMHVQRTAGILTALIMEGGASFTTKGEDGSDLSVNKFFGEDAVHGILLGYLYTNGTVNIADFSSDTMELVGYHQLWDFADTTWQQNLSNVVAANPEYVLCAGSGLDVYGQATNNTNVKIADVDSFTEAYGSAMQSGKVAYLAGKYSSSVGPIFAAVLNALNGAPIRTEKNEALALGQGYWVATSYADFTKYQNADTADAPIFNKSLLDTVICNVDAETNEVTNKVSYSTFKAFVEKDRTPN